jgi:hypothetical protein
MVAHSPFFSAPPYLTTTVAIIVDGEKAMPPPLLFHENLSLWIAHVRLHDRPHEHEVAFSMLFEYRSTFHFLKLQI